MTTLAGTIQDGGSQSWEARVDEDLTFTLEGSEQPYDIDIETKRRGEPDSAYERIQPFQDLSTITISDRQRHTYSTVEVEGEVRITVTNNAGETMTVDGEVGGESGGEYFIQDGRRWVYGELSQFRDFNSVIHINGASDLPSPIDGVRTLDGSTPYHFHTIVLDAATLDPAGSPLIGDHGSTSGYVCTGAGPAIQVEDNPFFARSLYFHAPGAQVFDLAASGDDTEFLFQDSSISDAIGQGNAGNLGTIDGFRVPTFKGVNFEAFDAGFTMTGDCDKVFIESSPLREVTASGVTIFEFDANFSTDIIDITDNYIKQVQSDTVVIDVDGSATVTEIFQYRGNTHDGTVTESNILTGQVGVTEVGSRVTDSFPLSDSTVAASYFMTDNATATTIDTQGDYEVIAGTTTTGRLERFTQNNDNEVTYDGQNDAEVRVVAVIDAVVASGSADIEFALFRNDSEIAGTAIEILSLTTSLGSITLNRRITVAQNDDIDVRVRNNTNTTNVTVQNLQVTI